MQVLFFKEKMQITKFSDVDWGWNIDSWKSTSGYIFMLDSTPITWNNKKQGSIVLSSIEFEYRAFMEATKKKKKAN